MSQSNVAVATVRKRSLLERIGRAILEVPNEALRDEWVRATLQAIPPGASILDAGCGSQKYKAYRSHLRYFGLDFAGYDGVGDDRGLAIEGCR